MSSWCLLQLIPGDFFLTKCNTSLSGSSTAALNLMMFLQTTSKPIHISEVFIDQDRKFSVHGYEPVR